MDLYQILLMHNRCWSLREIFCFSIIFLFISLLGIYLLLQKKIVLSQLAAGLTAVFFLAIVFASTVFTRTPSSEYEYMLELFWSWRVAYIYRSWGMLKEILLNCVLLFPFGALLPVIFCRRLKWYHGFVAGFLISAVIETSQLLFRRGLFEWDDMIHNAVGCMLGCVIMGVFFRNKNES